MTVIAIGLALTALGWYLEYRHQRNLVTELREELATAYEQAAFFAGENQELRDDIQDLANASQRLLDDVQGLAGSRGVIVPPPGGLVA